MARDKSQEQQDIISASTEISNIFLFRIPSLNIFGLLFFEKIYIYKNGFNKNITCDLLYKVFKTSSFKTTFYNHLLVKINVINVENEPREVIYDLFLQDNNDYYYFKSNFSIHTLTKIDLLNYNTIIINKKLTTLHYFKALIQTLNYDRFINSIKSRVKSNLNKCISFDSSNYNINSLTNYSNIYSDNEKINFYYLALTKKNIEFLNEISNLNFNSAANQEEQKNLHDLIYSLYYKLHEMLSPSQFNIIKLKSLNSIPELSKEVLSKVNKTFMDKNIFNFLKENNNILLNIYILTKESMTGYNPNAMYYESSVKSLRYIPLCHCNIGYLFDYLKSNDLYTDMIDNLERLIFRISNYEH